MTKTRDDERLVSELTVGELVELIRQVLREELANSDALPLSVQTARPGHAVPRSPDGPASGMVLHRGQARGRARGPSLEAAQATGERAGASSASPDYFIDEEGRLAFRSEAAYAAYLAKQAGKHPTEINAYYLDARGRKAIYESPAPEEGKAPAQPVPLEPSEERRPHPEYDIQTSDTDRHEAARRRLRGE